jgi:alkanesulfonate monooxygenase SsuD/methylene tetrahydromethanopterin reductase-like flavin-dependent oxidoreductase (luciferase family)
VTLPQFTDNGTDLVEGAARAVDAGLDSIWLFDHLWPLGNKERPILECWSCLAYVAATTESVKVGTLVTRSTLRVPALLASMAATVARIAPNRLIVGVGSGDLASKPENLAFGVPYLAGERRRQQLEEVIDGLARMRDQGTSLPFDVWAGGSSHRVLEMAARVADGYNCWGVGPEDVRRRRSELDDLGAGAVEVTWGGQVVVGGTEEGARRRLGKRNPEAFVTGDVGGVADRLAKLVEAGASHLVLASPFASDPDTFELLGDIAVRLRDGAG